MKYLVSIFTIAFFLTTVVFAQTQDKQQVKKDVKVEKVKKRRELLNRKNIRQNKERNLRYRKIKGKI